MSRLHWLVIFSVALFVAGCSDSGKPQNGGEAENSSLEDSEDSTASSDSEDGGETDAALEGKWMMIAGLLSQPVEIHIAVVEIGRVKNGELAADVLHSSEDFFPDAKLASSKFDGDSVELLFKLGEEGELNVQGTLDGDVIRGNAPTNSGVQPIRFVRTKEDKVTSTEPIPADGSEAFAAAMRSDDPVQNLRQFVTQFADSPAALTAYIQLIAMSKQEKVAKGDVEEFVSGFLKLARRWGTRMEQELGMKVASILARQRHFPELVLEILQPLEKSLSGEDEEDDELASSIKFTKAVVQLLVDDPKQQVAGAATLGKLNVENPFNFRYRAALAEYSERAGATDEALQFYGELAVLPGGEESLAADADDESEAEPAGEAVARLWKVKHGNTDGLEAFLDETYLEAIGGVAAEAEPAKTGGTQISLVELFTGAACPPCVAADIATYGLELTYDKSSLIVLRYHQHIPLPDPLTNADGETRFDYYEASGTPAVALNGRLIPNIAGPLLYSTMMYTELRKEVDPLLTADSAVTIELSAEAKEGQLRLSASVAGIEDVPETLRLRLVLAEDQIDFNASNGIRKHQMIVRDMPGGAEGIAAKEGKFVFSQTIPLAQLQQDQLDYLNTIERQFDLPFALPGLQSRVPSGPFPVKPLELKPLHFVAFLQDDATKEVLQAAVVPVRGELVYPVIPTEKPEPPAESQDAENGPVEAPVPSAARGDKADFGPKLISPSLKP